MNDEAKTVQIGSLVKLVEQGTNDEETFDQDRRGQTLHTPLAFGS